MPVGYVISVAVIKYGAITPAPRQNILYVWLVTLAAEGSVWALMQREGVEENKLVVRPRLQMLERFATSNVFFFFFFLLSRNCNSQHLHFSPIRGGGYSH